MIRLQNKTKNDFKNLARIILCLGVCVVFSALSFASVAFGKTASSTVTSLDSTLKTGDEAYSSIITNGTDAVNVSGIAGTQYFNLNSNCPISASGAKNDELFGIKLTGSEGATVNVTNSATISVVNDVNAAKGFRCDGLKVKISPNDKLTIKNVTSDNSHSAVALEWAGGSLDSGAIEIGTVSGGADSNGILWTSAGTLNTNKDDITIGDVKGDGGVIAGLNFLQGSLNCGAIKIDAVTGGNNEALGIVGINWQSTGTLNTNGRDITINNITNNGVAYAGGIFIHNDDGGKGGSIITNGGNVSISNVSSALTAAGVSGVELFSGASLTTNGGNLTVKNISNENESEEKSILIAGVAINEAGTLLDLGNGVLTIDGVRSGGIAYAAGLSAVDGATFVHGGPVYIRNIKAAVERRAFAILSMSTEGDVASNIQLGYDKNGNLSGGICKIEGDVMSSVTGHVPRDRPDVKIALQNDASFLKGNLLAPVHNGYNLEEYVYPSVMELSLMNGGTWYPVFDADNKYVTVNDAEIRLNKGGVIDMAYTDWAWGANESNPVVSYDGKREFYTLTINDNFVANGGIFRIRTDLANNTGDVIFLGVTGHNPRANVQIAYDPSATAGKIVKGTHTFLKLFDQKMTITAMPYVYDRGGTVMTLIPTVENENGGTDAGNEWKIVSIVNEIIKVSETTKAVSDSAMAMGAAFVATANNLQKRLGDLRSGAESNTGWVRFERNNDNLNMTRHLNISSNMYQIGYDFALKNDATSRGYFGLSLEHFDGTLSFGIGGGDLKSTSLGVYYTKVYNSGHYFDFIFRYGRYESDTTSYDFTIDNPKLTKLDYALNGVTFSGEYGYRWNLGKSGFYLEPQAEIIYGYLGSAKTTSNTGYVADIDSSNHFITRCGVALGQRVKNFNYYLRTSYLHNFGGTSHITYDDTPYKQDGAKNWWEVSVGGGWNMSNTSYFYAELTKHFKDISNSVNFNLGFRFTL